MKRLLKQKLSNKQRLRTRFILLSGATIVVLTLTTGWLVFLNISLNVKIKASANGNGGMFSNGELVSEFTWEHDPVTKATIGPDAIKISNTAHTAIGGKASTSGLSAGKSSKGIDMEIESSSVFDAEGIDISIDFKRHEPSGGFFARGKSLDFGFKKGFLYATYRTANLKGGYETVGEITDYEIPTDEQFRNYRFIYDPISGKGEIFVNNVIVWSHQGETNKPLYWTDAGNIIIAKGINGGGLDQPVLDNLIIRAISVSPPIGESLVSFILENSEEGILIYWSTITNDKTSYFALERSINGLDFVTVDKINAEPDMNEVAEYSYTDKTALHEQNVSSDNSNNVTPNSPSRFFYRIRQVFKDGKSATNAVAAIKIRSLKILSIEKVNPDPFQTTFNLSYYTPASGRVWVQLIDEKGKIKSSETFEAQQGKNIYFFRNKNNLPAGNYVLNLMQNDKRISAKVTKM